MGGGLLGAWLDWTARNVTGACTGSELKTMLPPQCHSAASKHHGRWGAAPHGFHVSERYGDLVTGCFGETLLTTRAELGSLYPVWRNGIPDSRWSGCLVTLVRRLASSGFVDARLLLPQPLHMSHNAAMVCVNGTLHVFGGQYSEVMRGEERLFRGVVHTSLRSLEEPFSTPHLIFDRARLLTTRCVERRMQRRGLCEFDGKLSVVYWRERFWLYARANLHATGGARHVQVSSSADLRSWSNWELLRFDGVYTGKADNNIYYMQVSASGSQLLGFLPGSINGEAGIFATRSINGVAWDQPVRLLTSEAIEHRTQDHPIGLRAHAHWMISSIFIWDQSTRWVAQHRCDNCYRANHTRSQFLMRDPTIAVAMRALEQKGPRLRQLSTRGNTTSDLAWDTARWRDVAVQPFKYSCVDRGCQAPLFAHIPGSSCHSLP